MTLSPLACDIEEMVQFLVPDGGEERAEFVTALRQVADYYEKEEDWKGFLCLDCSVNTLFIGEYYVVTHDLWLEANPDKDGMLCIGCLETRLGRGLTGSDFLNAPINERSDMQSERLRDRLGSVFSDR